MLKLIKKKYYFKDILENVKLYKFKRYFILLQNKMFILLN